MRSIILLIILLANSAFSMGADVMVNTFHGETVDISHQSLQGQFTFPPLEK